MSKNQSKPLWTDDQKKAIDESGTNILVAAAAGSGKTAVLVERMIKKILSDTEKIDVDQLLVVTFTNAAAAEMRNRIGEALEKALLENPTSTHLRRQLTLLNKASISTLHSFCMNVVRTYYHQLDIDPHFRIADQTEAELLRDEALSEVLEEAFSKENNELFLTVAESYSSDRSDDVLLDVLRKLHDFSRSNPRPNDWLDEIVESYANINIDTIEDSKWVRVIIDDVVLNLNGLKESLQFAISLSTEDGGPTHYKDTLEIDVAIIDRLLFAATKSWSELYNEFQILSFERFKTKKGEFDEVLQERIKKIRDQYKKQINKIKDELFSRPLASFVANLNDISPQIEVLVQLVKQFDNRYWELKKEKGIVDFSDLEHLCLQLLRDSSSTKEQEIPSAIAISYKNQFKEVMVDEYQDTNQVQETIISFISNGKNAFMVGDVKQSIYRFRLAEPELFMDKYERYVFKNCNDGVRIDLSQNFRSRNEIISGTNFIFKQIMDKRVGEMEYDDKAELKFGAKEYPAIENNPINVLLIDQTSKEQEQEDLDEEIDSSNDQAELDKAQLEARVIGNKIIEMINSGTQVWDKNKKEMRSVTYRDIVILFRSFTWAPTIMDELKQLGIPVYAEISTGYFDAMEVTVMMSLLSVIDNPYQDIPLVSVLRSPIVGLNDNELATIRIVNKRAKFYEALKDYLKTEENENLHRKVNLFISRLNRWRNQARKGNLTDLIWQIYRETGYYDFVGGLPGGKQRQANLRAFQDRARQYEETSFRGLFRFLRFIERMRERGDDLGTAKALGEQEDVVRMMTMHKSKGLEFPVVFIAGLNKSFNMQDLKGKVIFHKKLGFGTKYINNELRVTIPTLPQLAISRKIKMEMIAEEMRVLYVALTRAKEKLFLVGTVKDLNKSLEKWSEHLYNSEWLLSDYNRANCNSFLDWIGPALMRHPAMNHVLTERINVIQSKKLDDESKWAFEFPLVSDLSHVTVANTERKVELEDLIKNRKEVPISSVHKEAIITRLEWQYPNQASTNQRAKQSVTELKRLKEVVDEYTDRTFTKPFKSSIGERPRFLQQKSITPAERGTAMHLVMQQLQLKPNLDEDFVKKSIEQLVENEFLTKEQAMSVDVSNIVAFFETDIGQRLLKSSNVRREVPFSLGIKTSEIYKTWDESNEERILVQGVIDCLFEDDDRLILIDYKTDDISNRFNGDFEKAKPILIERYETQMNLYKKAVKEIFAREPDVVSLFFFDGCSLLEM